MAQCSSCRFENMPGVGACGRCGSPLGLNTLAVDVHPPRAAPWNKRLRRWLPFRSAYYEARDAGRRLAREGWLHNTWGLEIPRARGGVLARLIVPGWAQLHLGHQLHGRIFLGVYLAFLFLALLLYGTTVGSMFLGLAFSVHVASCISILRFEGGQLWAFWRGVALVFTLLVVGVYLPAGWLVSRAVSPALIQMSGATFDAGDVLLYSPALYWFRAPRPGDVVLYHQEGGSYPMPPPQHGYYRIAPGERIDRILAGPGDRVYWKDGQLTVNGQASSLQPLNPAAIARSMTFTVPAGHYLILPTAGPGIPGGLPDQHWHDLCVVSADAIRGRVFLRSYPFNRLRRFS